MDINLLKKINEYETGILQTIMKSNSNSIIVVGKPCIGKTYVAKKMYNSLKKVVFVSGFPKNIREKMNQKVISKLKNIDLHEHYAIVDENFYLFTYLACHAKKTVLFSNQRCLLSSLKNSNILMIDMFSEYLKLFSYTIDTKYKLLESVLGIPIEKNNFDFDRQIYLKTNQVQKIMNLT